MQDKTQFLVASALKLPMQDAMFDGVSIMHLGMNVEDKLRMLSEAYRVLKPGKRLAICEIMLGPVAEPLTYPVPWADTAENSFLVEPETYRALAAEAGFAPVSELDFYTETLGQSFPRRTSAALSGLGSHLILSVAAAQKISNHNENLRSGRVVAVQMSFDKP
jgi:SAM-dependent methyltransferase